MKPASQLLRKKSIAWFLLVLLLFQTISCTYFKVKSTSPQNLANVEDIGEIYQQFIIHQSDQTYGLTKIQVDSLYLSGKLDVPSDTFFYQEGREFRYKTNEKDIINEVHIYLKSDAEELKNGLVKIPYNDIQEIKIIDRDEIKTVASYTFTTLGAIAAGFTLVVIIALATKSSCPYVYAHDGNGFIFQGETFGGAIAQNLVRNDYMPLPNLKPLKNQFRIRISNELQERQYTDIAELIAVKHERGTSVLLDKNGDPHEISNPTLPLVAKGNYDIDLRNNVTSRDQDVYSFNETDATSNQLFLTFEKPTDAQSGKLILNAKNSLWFDYVFGEFLEKFGSHYERYMQKQSEISQAERTQRVIDSDIPLFIYLKENGNWKLVDYLFTIGPMASRDLVVPMELTEMIGEEVEVKLETGFLFWEVDYAAMDFSVDPTFETEIIKPQQAIGTSAIDWTATLSSVDEKFMAQEKTGQVTEISYALPTFYGDADQSIFLHTRGYYELVRDFKGLPDVSELRSFKTPGHFSSFSESRYLNFWGLDDQIALETEDSK